MLATPGTGYYIKSLTGKGPEGSKVVISMGSTIKALVVEGHVLVREGLKAVLSQHFKRIVFGEADNAQEALEKAWQHPWDVVLLDISLPGRGGLDVLKELRRGSPKLPVIVISPHHEEQHTVRALKLGAVSYLGKRNVAEDYVKAVEAALRGVKYITPMVAEQLAAHVGRDHVELPHQGLSDREFQVMSLLASGKIVKEIAADLFLSVKTVSTYRSRIMEKLGCKNNAHVIRYAVRYGLENVAPVE